MTDNIEGVERTIHMGSMVYTDAEGKTRRADHGAVVRVHPKHVERFDRLNRPMITEADAEAERAKTVESTEADADDDKPSRRRPTSTARKDS